RPSAASASTTCAVTSADGGSVTSPKSQNGSLPTSLDVLSASKAPQPPSLDCMPVIHRTARSLAAADCPPPPPPHPPRSPPPPPLGPPGSGVRGQGPAPPRDPRPSRVVDARVAVVVEPDRPAGRGEPQPADLPVARPVDLLVQHPSGRRPQPGMIGRQACVGQRDDGQDRVPDR